MGSLCEIQCGAGRLPSAGSGGAWPLYARRRRSVPRAPGERPSPPGHSGPHDPPQIVTETA